jgi:hypothetical protein
MLVHRATRLPIRRDIEHLFCLFDPQFVRQRHAVLDRRHLGQYRHRDFRRRPAADINADGTAQPIEFVFAEIEIRFEPLAPRGIASARAQRAT